MEWTLNGLTSSYPKHIRARAQCLDRCTFSSYLFSLDSYLITFKNQLRLQEVGPPSANIVFFFGVNIIRKKCDFFKIICVTRCGTIFCGNRVKHVGGPNPFFERLLGCYDTYSEKISI